MAENERNNGKINGRHAAIAFVLFFGVVAAVNFLMAGFATSTFGGTVVDNSYVASQKYNGWLAQARAQKALGWTVSKPARQNDRIITTVTNRDGDPLSGAMISAIAEHPVGQTKSIGLKFTETVPGSYRSVQPLPEGRWKLKLVVSHQNKEMRLSGEIK